MGRKRQGAARPEGDGAPRAGRATAGEPAAAAEGAAAVPAGRGTGPAARQSAARAARQATGQAAGQAAGQPGSSAATGASAVDEGHPGTAAAGSFALLALALGLAPALGVPHELMLQDTLKSIVVSFAALLSAAWFFWSLRDGARRPAWHPVLLLPLALMAYALGSMAWAHRFLAGVEAVRWFVFALVLWLALNTGGRGRLSWLAWAVHLGAVLASFWAALQFWADLSLFPQGPPPSSTFINRNFFAEYVVCTLPFSAWLLARSRLSGTIALVAASTGLVITAILMTGTRAALLAMWVQLLLVLPLLAWRLRRQLAFAQWPRGSRVLAAGVLVGTVVLLGLLPTGNPRITEEGRGDTALARGLQRTQSIRPDDHSLGIRMVMWRATLRLIADRPLAGVGAGNWEAQVPLYQEEGSQLETDYYVHNEFLQLVAEYGLLGWAVLLALAGWLLRAAWRTWRMTGTMSAGTAEGIPGSAEAAAAEAQVRAVALCSLLALFIVSNIGFPWRMAATGALFAVCLGVLAASDLRLRSLRLGSPRPASWRPGFAWAGLGATAAAAGLALFITAQAATAEARLVRAAQIAVSITASGRPQDPQWEASRREMLQLVREGIAINPHYRKVTPIVADELARWGDWRNAVWIWESVLASRPHIVAIISNAARGYFALGEADKANSLLAQAKLLQPRAPAVRSLEVVMLARQGKPDEALRLARESMAAGIEDYDLLNAAFVLGARAGDRSFAAEAMARRIRERPASAGEGHLQLAQMYAEDARDADRAMKHARLALESTPPEGREALLQRMPPLLRQQVAGTKAAPAVGQGSAAATR